MIGVCKEQCRDGTHLLHVEVSECSLKKADSKVTTPIMST